MARVLAWLFTSVALAIVLGFALVSLGFVTVPPAYHPWTPLNPRDEPNVLTRYKLTRLERDPAECSVVLRLAEIAYTAIPDQAGWTTTAIARRSMTPTARTIAVSPAQLRPQ